MKNLKLFYKKQFNLYGATPKGVAWTDSNKSKNRYKTLLKIIQLGQKKKFSILDVGCGYGELVKYLPKNKNFKYTGIDVVEEMITYSKKTYKDKKLKFKLADILQISKSYDYIICNGIFTLKNDLTEINKSFKSKNSFKGKIGIFDIKNNKINHRLNFYKINKGNLEKIF